jgi:outer membrane receptor protein involved in Fe transport
VTGAGSAGTLLTSEQYSDELRLAGTALNKRLDYQVGAYYDRDNESQYVALNEFCGSVAFPVTPANPGGCALPTGIAYNYETDEESRALFGQINYEIIDNLRATAGFRETWEDINLRYIDDGSVPGDVYQLEHVPLPPVLSEHEPSWTLGLDYQLTPETLLYIAQRGGYRVRARASTRSSRRLRATWSSVLSMPDDWVMSQYASTLMYMRRESGMRRRSYTAGFPRSRSMPTRAKLMALN